MVAERPTDLTWKLNSQMRTIQNRYLLHLAHPFSDTPLPLHCRKKFVFKKRRIRIIANFYPRGYKFWVRFEIYWEKKWDNELCGRFLSIESGCGEVFLRFLNTGVCWKWLVDCTCEFVHGLCFGIRGYFKEVIIVIPVCRDRCEMITKSFRYG